MGKVWFIMVGTSWPLVVFNDILTGYQ